MTVRVEFLGMPRQYAGCDVLEVEAATLHAALDAVARKLPGLAGRCIDSGVLKPGFLSGVNGRFAVEPQESLAHGDTVQILSADVGG